MRSNCLELRKVAPSSSVLERSAQVLEAVHYSDEVVDCLVNVRLQAGFGKLPRELRVGGASDVEQVTCNLELWVVMNDGEEVAYCQGVLCPESKALALRWIGRSEGRTVHEQFRGQRCINVDESEGTSSSRTIAEALIGLISILGERLGARQLRLQALDTGSGKLVQFYEALGFTAQPLQTEDEGLSMQAPIAVISILAPPTWLIKLGFTEFDLKEWLQQSIRHYQGLENVGAAALPWRRTWEDAFGRGPARLKVVVEASAELHDGQAQFKVELTTSFCGAGEIVVANGVVQEGTQLLVLQWLGRSRRRPVHKLVKGTLAFEGSHGKVTVAMAMLGILVVLARGFGASTAQLEVLDDGRGKLAGHVKRYGFVEVKPSPDASSTAEDNLYCKMKASCEDLANRCCPWVWRVRLPPPGAFLSSS